MMVASNRPSPKRPTNLSLDPELLKEARSLDINVSQAAESGVQQAVKAAKTAAWKRENAAAIESSNTWVEENGLPLEKYRPF